MTVVSLPGSATSLTLAEAVARFLDRYRDQKHTATTYAETLTHLRTVAGDASAVGALTPEVFAAAMTRWDRPLIRDVRRVWLQAQPGPDEAAFNQPGLAAG